MSNFNFPIDLKKVQPVKINPWTQTSLSADQKKDLLNNIQICRDAIVFFTACGSASGYGGHTGGAFDTVPEVMLFESFFRACPDKFVPILFDEAGHRVATQYLLSVLHGDMPADELVNYRKGHAKLPGHPELGLTPGVKFSSGRLGHMWPYVNGVSMANPDKICVLLGSDGSQQEGDNAEAARLAVAQGLNVKLFIDDNDVTIAGHPSSYMPGFSVQHTLEGHGVHTNMCPGEDLDALYAAVRGAVVSEGPRAVVIKRKMCPGIAGVEGSPHGHDAVAVKHAIPHLEKRGYPEAAAYLKTIKPTKDPHGKYLGAGKAVANRKEFGEVVSEILSRLTAKEKKERVMVIDCDLEGSTGLNTIRAKHPDIFVKGGIMERGNISAAAGFGMAKGKQGIFSTFAAFLEMCCSELTMARLNNSNLLCHFSHSGCDDMADNTCHFGINNFFADNGLDDAYETRLYFPADSHQLRACVENIFWKDGMRFVFTTRSSCPAILDSNGKEMYGSEYKFVPGKDEIVREGTAGYIVSYGDALYRCLDAVERLKMQGIDVGLVNKSTLNVVDEEMMNKVGKAPLCLVVESLSTKNGLGIRYGTWLLQRGFAPRYGSIGTHHEGSGGLWEHAYHQGYDSKSVMAKVMAMRNLNAKL